MDTRIAPLARGHHGLVGRPSLLDLGLSDRQIQHHVTAGQLVVVHPGVYIAPGAPSSREQRLLAACWAAGTEAVLSHRSAAWLWGLDGPFAEVVEITMPRLHKSRPKGVVAHRSTDLVPEHVTTRREVPVTKPARTLVDLGAVVHQRVLDRAVDDALGKRLVTFEGLLALLEEVGRRGRNGVGPLRKSLAERTDAPSNVLEAEFSRLIRRHGLPEPVYQYEVRDPSGGFVARVDAAYPDLGIVIELDGASTRARREALQYDVARQNRIIACGFVPLRYTWADTVGTPEKTAGGLRQMIGQRRGELGLSAHT